VVVKTSVHKRVPGSANDSLSEGLSLPMYGIGGGEVSAAADCFAGGHDCQAGVSAQLRSH
jgi:hypothetical protein